MVRSSFCNKKIQLREDVKNRFLLIVYLDINFKKNTITPSSKTPL
jgi:hypothetical protein